MWDIRRVDVASVLPVRHAVLWPDMSMDFCRVPEDAAGEHFACHVAAEIVSVASLFIEGETARLRKFATLPAWQGRGIGTAMLEYLFAQTRTRGVRYFWCNARLDATSFYARFGVQFETAPALSNGRPFVRMGVKISA